MRIDLLLNGPLGAWALEQVSAEQVLFVHSPSEVICARAECLGMAARCGDVNDGVDVVGEVGLSLHYPYLLGKRALGRYRRLYNLHPGLLPWGRGYYPVFWALWAGEPAGCTLHLVDEGVDTGAVVAQRSVPAYAWDTGGTLHERVSEAEKGLFLEYWPRIASGQELSTRPQDGQGSHHLRREFMALKESGQKGVSDGDLLRLVRCLSHPQYTGLEVCLGGRNYELSVREL